MGISPHGHQTWGPTLPPPLSTLDIRHRDLPLLLTSGYHHWRPFKTCILEDLNSPPPHSLVLESSGGHRNRFRWKVGGTHPTGMLSCPLLSRADRRPTLGFELFKPLAHCERTLEVYLPHRQRIAGDMSVTRQNTDIAQDQQALDLP